MKESRLIHITELLGREYDVEISDFENTFEGELGSGLSISPSQYGVGTRINVPYESQNYFKQNDI